MTNEEIVEVLRQEAESHANDKITTGSNYKYIVLSEAAEMISSFDQKEKQITKEIKKEAVAKIREAKSYIRSFSYFGLQGEVVQISEVERFIDEAIRKIESTNVAIFPKFNPKGRK